MQLTGRHGLLGTVRRAVYDHSTCAADPFSAVVFERDRLPALYNQRLVHHIQHLEERHVWADIPRLVSLEAAFVVRTRLTPDVIEGGYSASWLHGATGCSGPGPSGGTLYMCGGPLLEIVGSITGELDGGVLTIMGGSLNIGGTDYGVLGGMLGAFPAVDFMWSIVIAGLGTFYFDNIYMGTGLPNHFDGNDLILWGQNWNAYFCAVGRAGCDRWGIDLYGAKSSIPEPGTMGLLGIGLLGLDFSMRRRKT